MTWRLAGDLFARVPGEEADGEDGGGEAPGGDYREIEPLEAGAALERVEGGLAGDGDGHYEARVAGVDDRESDHRGDVEVRQLGPAAGQLPGVGAEQGVEDGEENQGKQECEEGYGGVPPE